ncbi:hypothetical protein MDAP_001582 [Mitosporidium daphniae]
MRASSILFPSIKAFSFSSIRWIQRNPSFRSRFLNYSAERAMSAANGKEECVDSSSPQKRTFKAETKRLLQIVADSLYSEKEVFVRELLSNSADACEKLKYFRLTEPDSVKMSLDTDLSISIRLDSEKNQFILEDKGIGMDLHELDSIWEPLLFLGRLHSLKNSIIGQFGVGFYSAFTVGKRIDVYSKSAKASSSDLVNVWSCENGDPEYSLYTISPDHQDLDGFTFGTRIVVHLKEEESKYASEKVVQDLIKKYSNFLSFPISLNGVAVNTLSPLWMLPKAEITEHQYKEFFNHISGPESSSESYKYVLHYSTDAPVQMRCILFVPKDISSVPYNQTPEQEAPKMSLYCKKVLIKGKTADLLPPWLSFIRGVVDSEDIPLNLSRELLQNSVLLSKIRKTLTARVIKWLLEEQRASPSDFSRFYRKISPYIKGGVMSEDKKEVSQLMMFETSKPPAPEGSDAPDSASNAKDDTQGSILTSLKSYVSRMPSDQKDIYICLAKNRNAALASPYYEPFKRRGIEVLFSYDPLDEFLIPSLEGLVDGKSVKRIEDVKLSTDPESQAGDPLNEAKLSDAQISELVVFLKKVFPSTVVQNIKASNRFPSHPALFVDHALQSTTFKYFKQMMALQSSGDTSGELFSTVPPLDLEINPDHPLIRNLFALHTKNSALATKISLQILDNARLEAGLLEDAHEMVLRVSSLLEDLTGSASMMQPVDPVVEVLEGETIKTDKPDSANKIEASVH